MKQNPNNPRMFTALGQTTAVPTEALPASSRAPVSASDAAMPFRLPDIVTQDRLESLRLDGEARAFRGLLRALLMLGALTATMALGSSALNNKKPAPVGPAVKPLPAGGQQLNR